MSLAENSQSTMAMVQLTDLSALVTTCGASGEDLVSEELDPICSMMPTLWRSEDAKKGSHYPLWLDGRSRRAGSSGKHTAGLPLAAPRSTSFAASARSPS